MFCFVNWCYQKRRKWNYGAFPATREKAVIEVSSYGGDNTGYQIPFNIHYTGEKENGTFNPTTKAFTAAVSPAK